MTDARQLVLSLKGMSIHTVTGRPNRILDVTTEHVVVSTTRSPQGQPIPLAQVQDAVNRLERDGEIEVSVPSLGYRSAFVGAVLAQLPGAVIVRRSPPRIRLPNPDRLQGA
jgi:hypothetical protein